MLTNVNHQDLVDVPWVACCCLICHAILQSICYPWFFKNCCSYVLKLLLNIRSRKCNINSPIELKKCIFEKMLISKFFVIKNSRLYFETFHLEFWKSVFEKEKSQRHGNKIVMPCLQWLGEFFGTRRQKDKRGITPYKRTRNSFHLNFGRLKSIFPRNSGVYS